MLETFFDERDKVCPVGFHRFQALIGDEIVGIDFEHIFEGRNFVVEGIPR